MNKLIQLSLVHGLVSVFLLLIMINDCDGGNGWWSPVPSLIALIIVIVLSLLHSCPWMCFSGQYFVPFFFLSNHDLDDNNNFLMIMMIMMLVIIIKLERI